jgi:hypothetical protein
MSVHAGLVRLFPREFRVRYREEMQLDFADELYACTTAWQAGLAVWRAYADLTISAMGQWRRHEVLLLLFCAGFAHGSLWLVTVAIAAWEWPGGSRLYPAVISFAVLSAPGIGVAIWRQRSHVRPQGYCSLGVAELD